MTILLCDHDLVALHTGLLDDQGGNYKAITCFHGYGAGYIQTPGWHPFSRSFAETRDDDFIRLWRLSWDNQYLPAEVLQTDITKFCVEVEYVPTFFFYGIRVLFSIHQASLSPYRHLDGLWNCSVPSWPDFRHHFVCNNKRNCTGQEDEMWCPVTSCQQGGIQLNENCYNYIFTHMDRNKTTWHEANAACEQQGADLAVFSTVNSWYHLALLTQNLGDCRIHIGLQSPDTRYPHMYRYALQWHNGAIAHYVYFLPETPPPTCGYIYENLPLLQKCAEKCVRYALCQTISSPVENVFQKRSAKGKSWHVSTEEIKNNNYHLFPFRSTVCPDKHRTHAFLAYDAFSACCHDYDIRLRDVNVTTDNVVRPVCEDVHLTLFKALFPCRSGARSIPYSLVCNHLQDCADNSDEHFCQFSPCSAVRQYRCTNGQCLQIRHHCDEVVQCVDGSDELDCISTDFDTETHTVLPRPPTLAEFDGHGFIVYSTLTMARKTSAAVCPNTHIFCPGDGYCLPVYVRCNGLHDCPGLEDEVDCGMYVCPGLYRCRGSLRICLHPDHLCDGWSQCPQHDDELFCNLTCPVGCFCLGYALTCISDFHVELFSRLRYLDASNIGLKPGRLIKSRMLVYLSLVNCSLSHLDNLTLPNLLSLDLSDNQLSAITITELNLMKNLQNFSLARNPLSKLFYGKYASGFQVHKNILHADLTGVELKVLNVPNNLPFPGLLSLNLSESGITHLIVDDFRSLTSLRILDLRGCPMTVFPKYVFSYLKDLSVVFAENYKLCCGINLPSGFNVDDCHAPLNEISSCDALLRANVYRVCLSVLAAFALSGNLGCFSLRIFSLTGRSKTGFNVFVTHLCVSDFVMGVYMAMVGIADRLYIGRYLWEESRWRNSVACQVAGVLALLSSEVSAIIICLITLDRFLVIRFPFSRIRFSSFSAQVVSLITWTVVIVLVTAPLLPATAYEHFYGQTGICVPLPITRNDFPGHRYAFGVMIILNLVIFLFIATGQISVYLAITNNAMSSIDMTRKSRDLIVARRLITVVMSDFLCWFPLGLLGVLAAQGVPVSGEVNVAMAIFVLPLNSALNPFLYTLNMIQEKRQRATEVKLLNVIMERGIGNSGNVTK